MRIFAVGRGKITGDNLDQGRLTGPVIAHEAEDFALVERHIHFIERVNRAEVLGNLTQFEESTNRPPPRSPRPPLTFHSSSCCSAMSPSQIRPKRKGSHRSAGTSVQLRLMLRTNSNSPVNRSGRCSSNHSVTARGRQLLLTPICCSDMSPPQIRAKRKGKRAKLLAAPARQPGGLIPDLLLPPCDVLASYPGHGGRVQKHLFGLVDVPAALPAGVGLAWLRLAHDDGVARGSLFRFPASPPRFVDLLPDEPLRRRPFFHRLSPLAALHRHIARMRA